MNKEWESITEQVKEKLRVYDVFKGWEDKEECREKFEEKEKYGVEYYKEPEQLAMFVLSEMFPAGSTVQDLFECFTNFSAPYECTDKRMPESMKKIFQRTSKNLEVFCHESWRVYAKDVLRAVAYHDYIENLIIEQEDVTDRKALYNKIEFGNFPIDDIEIKLDNNKKQYLILKLGGRMLEKFHLANIEKKWNFRCIFKKEKDEFDKEGNFRKIKEKGIGYDNFKNGIKELTNQSLSAADIWFIKNVLDPELISAVNAMKKKKYLNSDDYKLLWILCRCKCPSVRIYLFEAIKPCYLYIKNYIKFNEDCIEFLMGYLERTVSIVNEIFQSMVDVADYYFHDYKSDDSLLERCNMSFNQIFERGDDFPFILSGFDNVELTEEEIFNNVICAINNGESREQSLQKQPGAREGEYKRKYYEYLPEDNGGGIAKITYAVITALNERWKSKDDERKENTGRKILHYQENFKYLLFAHTRFFL